MKEFLTALIVHHESTVVSKIIENTSNTLVFDLSQEVPNRLVSSTFGSIFIISVGLAIYIKHYAKKKGYKRVENKELDNFIKK